ncbi:MAG: sel1 repeat family protein, partial [Neisseriaceae bacterium]|nr:sel1 repeat family protein [Neisseriaceae bacterium]
NIQEKHDETQYAKAQLNLGVLYYEQGDIEQAKQHWLNIQEKHDETQYAKAQFNLGVLYDKQGDIEQAKQHWLNIQEKHDETQYAHAQFLLGVLYEEQGDIEQAKQHGLNIQEKHDKKTYTHAQFLLGILYEEQGDIEQAKQHWLNIQEKHDKKTYAHAQFLLGVLYRKQDDIEQAKQHWLNIQEKHDETRYAKAQLNLGFLYDEQGDIEQAKQHWLNIQEKHDETQYAKAQLNLGVLYYEQGDIEQAKQHWLNIQKEYDLEAYAKARFMLAIIYAKEENEEEFKQCIIKPKEYYQDDGYIKNVMNNVQNARILLKNKGILLEILDHYLGIRNALQVVSTDTPVNSSERAFAHYTEVDSAINLLKNKEKEEENQEKKTEKQNKEENKVEKEWNFRMASVEQLNDPTEGQVLFEFLNNYSDRLKQQNITIEKSEEWAVFTACFTFNHDSLNQFRLYGKKQNQEATGVSLVFQPSFFRKSHSGIMNEISTSKKEMIEEIMKRSTEQSQNNGFGTPNIQTTPNNDDMEEHNKQDEKTLLLPLYRCIYLDPESFMENENGGKVPYLKIAARDELTFYREKDKKVNDFKKYKIEIENIERKVSELFEKMIKNMEILFSNLNKNENNEEIFNILGLILLPLSHLIKHSAFHEEQECRIIYCCPFDDEDIDKTESHKAKIFREYRPIINDKDIARIYLSKGAENYAHIFKSLGIKTVRISSNPFRTAEKE